MLLVLACVPVAAAPRVELYTMGPGEELFSKFGHAALCVVDSERPGTDTCYNYGTTDFSRPVGLGWDVIRGQAIFWVSISDRVSMMLSFENQDRTVYRQVLPLDPASVQSLTNALRADALPENREYIYSHFLDNCSTRPRDLIDDAVDGELRRSTIASELTYRDYAREGLAASHWALVPGGDLILGRWVDQDIAPYAAMFIPEVLARGVAAALGVDPDSMYRRRGPPSVGSVRAALARFWILVAALGALAWIARWGARVALATVVVLGVAVWFGSLVSPWPELRVNELALVLVPFDVLLWRSARPRYVTLRLAMLVVIALLALVGVFVQPIWPFWVLAFATLSSFWWRTRKDILAT